jgi:hypothetical protein
MTTAELIDCLRYRPVATTAAQMRQAADEIERLQAMLDGDIHSCSVHCTRPLCVAQRVNARLVATINQQQDRIEDLQRQLQNRS